MPFSGRLKLIFSWGECPRILRYKLPISYYVTAQSPDYSKIAMHARLGLGTSIIMGIIGGKSIIGKSNIWRFAQIMLLAEF